MIFEKEKLGHLRNASNDELLHCSYMFTLCNCYFSTLAVLNFTQYISYKKVKLSIFHNLFSD